MLPPSAAWLVRQWVPFFAFGRALIGIGSRSGGYCPQPVESYSLGGPASPARGIERAVGIAGVDEACPSAMSVLGPLWRAYYVFSLN